MARYDDMMPACMDEDDSEDEFGPSGSAAHKGKPRRKSHQRPQGSDQIRQAFSKRKKGLVLKAYQLSALTDAKVFMFIVNDKGTSWAYATPGYGPSLNPELLKELRALAQVPEQAKLVTEVMPDPPGAKAADITSASEQAAMRRGDQVPGYSFPCTRAATGSLPSRSRSSYSGGSAGDAPGSEVAQLARAGSTTTTRTLQSALQVDEQSPNKPHARPQSVSSFACGRPGSAAHNQFFLHPRPIGKPGASMEPPTPCGVYNLLGQPISAAIESPTVVSDMAASSASPVSRQQLVPPDMAAGVQVATGGNAAGYACADLPTQQLQERPDQQKQQYWQQQSHVQWAVPEQQQEMELCRWGLHHHNYGAAANQHDECAAVEVAAAPYVGARQCSSVIEFKPSVQQQEFMSYDGATTHTAGAAAQHRVEFNIKGWQQQQQQASARPAPIYGSSQGAFESMQRGLPPLRVSRASLHADADGARTAPVASISSAMAQPTQWVSRSLRDSPLWSAVDAPTSNASGNGYSSRQHRPSFAQQMRSCNSSFTDDKGRACLVSGTAAGNTAAALVGQQDPCSAAESPTAALSQQMVSVLAVESPMHSPMHMSHEQYQQTGSGQMHEAYHHQQQQQRHDQGAYIPRTDDLVSDPLMDMLMDQALNGSLGGRMPPVQQQRQHSRPNPQVSIMEATLQHGAGVEQQQYEQMQPQYSQQQQAVTQLQSPMTAGVTNHSGICNDPSAAAGMPHYTGAYLRMMEMLKHMPLVSDPGRKAWEEQVRQLKATLAPHESKEFSTYVRALWQSREKSAASPGAAVTPAGSGGVINVSGARASGPGIGGKHRHGPSRLSTTASPCVDAHVGDIAAACGMTAGMSASSMPRLQAMLTGGPVDAAAAYTGHTAQNALSGFDAAETVAAAALGSVATAQHQSGGAYHMLPVSNITAGTAQQLNRGGEGVSTAAALHVASTVGPERTASAPLPAISGLVSESISAHNVHCSSPLKRDQSSFCGSSPGVIDAAVQRAMSPLKRTCRDMPEAAGFPAPSQAVAPFGGGARAWTARAATGSSHRTAEGLSRNGSCEKADSMATCKSSPVVPELSQNAGEVSVAVKPSAGMCSEAVAADGNSNSAAAAAAGRTNTMQAAYVNLAVAAESNMHCG